ncbi:hypothetical protein ACPOL_0951 [Acidisarcina polymorpha]|uniref:Uncharacterized protein n=1 Tax=Acidisarcina polymorpha TaxID=2211140 RepID=A0A2Z5FUY3_9BACT|nr:hypothetical protein ACPOL_0951 [Acidisarcina polymorpha]
MLASGQNLRHRVLPSNVISIGFTAELTPAAGADASRRPFLDYPLNGDNSVKGFQDPKCTLRRVLHWEVGGRCELVCFAEHGRTGKLMTET